jgi:hypothetical protein
MFFSVFLVMMNGGGSLSHPQASGFHPTMFHLSHRQKGSSRVTQTHQLYGIFKVLHANIIFCLYIFIDNLIIAYVTDYKTSEVAGRYTMAARGV